MSSEFGSGVVVPLVKFSEHIGDDRAIQIERAIKWVKSTPMEREKILADPDDYWAYVLAMDERSDSPEHMLAKMIQMWAYAASDHLADVDESRAPKSLNELVRFMFELRLTSEQVGEEEWVRVLALWSASAMDIDEMIGVAPDWGEW